MTNDHQLSIANISRFGLPFVVGIFYVTATLGFGFTADSTFQMANVIKNGSISSFDGFPSPLWQFLLIVGGWFHLDAILVAKMLSLILSCVIILLMYLIVNEILRDRLIALLVSLVLAMQGWMLQLAPSGSAIGLAIVLVLAGLFFILRNEYVVAPFILGLCTLMFWQAVFLLIPLCADIWINSVSKRRASKVILSAFLVYLCALLPLVLYEWNSGVNGAPALLQIMELSRFPPVTMIVLIVLGVLATVGLVLSVRPSTVEKDALRTHSSVITFIIVLMLMDLFFGVQVWLVVLPLIVMYSFFGMAEVLKHFQHEPLFYSSSFVLSGLLLVYFQFEYQKVTKPAMTVAIEQSTELRIAGEWLKANSPASINTCAERPDIVEYYAERPVHSLQSDGESCGDILVTSTPNVQGYEIVFRPGEAPGLLGRHFAVWRKQ